MRRRAAPPPAPLPDRSSRMPSFMVLNLSIDLRELDDTPPPEWKPIYCSSKKAYGCGIYGQKLVEGLALYVRRDYPADPTSSLAIRLSDEALLNIRAEFGGPSGRLQGHGVVSNVCQQLLTINVNFSTYIGTKRTYCLVFDSTDASLCMIPFIPSPFEACYMRSVVPFRGASEEDHQLTVLSYASRKHYLSLCTPETRANSSAASDDHSSSPWKVTEEMPFPEISSPPFMMDMTFSIQEKVFWVDLARGAVYCDLGAADGALKFNFIKLPKAYRVYWDMSSDEPAPELPVITRTMGCDGDSIKFVCIDSSKPGRGNETVKILTLDLDHGHERWKESKGVPWKELWKKVNSFMPMAKLGDVVPQYPTLMPDGTLCLLCKNTRQMLEEPDFFCRFDMCSKSLLSAGPVIKHLEYRSRGYLVTPYNFFTMCNPPRLRKRKLPELPSRETNLFDTDAFLESSEGATDQPELGPEQHPEPCMNSRPSSATPQVADKRSLKRPKTSTTTSTDDFYDRYFRLKKEEIERFVAMEEKKMENSYSIKNCVTKLEEMAEVLQIEVIKAADIFKDSPTDREVFLSFSTDALRLGWLRKQL